MSKRRPGPPKPRPPIVVDLDIGGHDPRGHAAAARELPARPDWLPDQVYDLFDPQTCIDGVLPWQHEAEGIEGLRETFRRICTSPRAERFWRGPFGECLELSPAETWRIADDAEIRCTEGRFRGAFGSGRVADSTMWFLMSPTAREKKAREIRDKAHELHDLITGTPFEILALESILGSDPSRSLFTFGRIQAGVQDSGLLFKPAAVSKKV